MLYPAELRGLLAFDTPSTAARPCSICHSPWIATKRDAPARRQSARLKNFRDDRLMRALSEFTVRIQPQTFADTAEHIAVF
jgi:hypothetical protein